LCAQLKANRADFEFGVQSSGQLKHIVGRLVPGRDPLRLALIQYAVCGLLSGVVALERGTWEGGILLAGPAILHAGVLSTGLAHTRQILAQRHAPPTHAAIIMSTESVFAALSGWLMLDEQLTGQQLAGCGLMLAGMLLAQLGTFVRKRS
jgi:drug/metabolite transporter (DMT)-like permease